MNTMHLDTLRLMLLNIFNFIFGIHNYTDTGTYPITVDLTAFYHTHVKFYRQLNTNDQTQFEKRALAFLHNTKIVGHNTTVEDSDRLLIAASAIIPVWAFPQWHYFNLQEVILVTSTFNNDYEVNKDDSRIRGMVGSGHLRGKMILSKTALHSGFSNTQDKKNVGIHEFAHLIDMADGSCDGFPAQLSEHSFSIPWLEMVARKISDIDNNNSNIDNYGATNNQEFFAVASEYFFERPRMMQRKHSALYDILESFYQQDRAAIDQDLQPKRKAPCPCGSTKKYKNCCEPE